MTEIVRNTIRITAKIVKEKYYISVFMCIVISNSEKQNIAVLTNYTVVVMTEKYKGTAVT